MDIATITSDPRWLRATPEQKKQLISLASDAPPGFKEMAGPIIKQAVSEATMQPGTFSRGLMSDPIIQAKALPPLAGTAGGLSGIPGGSTAGTVIGRQISNAALRSYGRKDQIPSGADQLGEAALSAGGDISAFPAINKGVFGRAVGDAEKLSGIADIEKTAPPGSARTAVKLIQFIKQKMLDGALSMEAAKSLKPAVKMISTKGWLQGTEYAPDLVEASRGIQEILNQDPVRKAASDTLALSQTVPNYISRTIQSIPVPGSVKAGFGATTGGGLAWALGKRIFGKHGEGR